jgi:hypothetical protein
VIFRLDPTDLEHPAWQASTIKQSVWVRAELECFAREKVARVTATLVKPLGRYSTIQQSPWYLEKLTTCTLDPTRAGVPVDQVTTADGRLLGLAA